MIEVAILHPIMLYIDRKRTEIIVQVDGQSSLLNY